MRPAKHDFVKEDPWRIFRIMSEFVEGFEELSGTSRAVSIFGSARSPRSSVYYKKAEETAFLLAKNGHSIITGAGGGIMEAANKGAKRAGGESIGLNILIPTMQKPNRYITKLLEFRYFFCRRVMFIKYARACIVFPGGFGTLDEFSEVVTLVQTQRITPLPIVFFGKKFWAGLIGWMRSSLLHNGMIDEADLRLFSVVDTPADVLNAIDRFYRFKGPRATE